MAAPLKTEAKPAAFKLALQYLYTAKLERDAARINPSK